MDQLKFAAQLLFLWFDVTNLYSKTGVMTQIVYICTNTVQWDTVLKEKRFGIVTHEYTLTSDLCAATCIHIFKNNSVFYFSFSTNTK